MEKSYKDGIMDAIRITSRWKNLGVHPSIVNTILKQLEDLLESPENSDKTKQTDITNVQNKSQENND